MARWQANNEMERIYSSGSFTNPLEPESNAQGTLQKTQDVNDHPLFCMFLANDFSGCLLSQQQYVDYI